MRWSNACSAVTNVVSSAKGDLMNGVVVEEQLEQVVKGESELLIRTGREPASKLTPLR